MWISPPTLVTNPHWASIYSGLFSGLGRESLRLFGSYDPSPIVGWSAAISARPICEPKPVWAPKILVARTARLCDFDETEGDNFAYRRADCMTVHAVVLEVVVGDNKPSILASFLATMVCKLDFKPRQDLVS